LHTRHNQLEILKLLSELYMLVCPEQPFEVKPRRFYLKLIGSTSGCSLQLGQLTKAQVHFVVVHNTALAILPLLVNKLVGERECLHVVLIELSPR
jgi:hypothetical protein